jgi:hypothetical protein
MRLSIAKASSKFNVSFLEIRDLKSLISNYLDKAPQPMAAAGVHAVW